MAKTKRQPTDLAILQGPTEDGKGARVVRLKDGVVSAGEIRPAREGEPLQDRELVRLSPVHDSLPICEVEVLHDGKAEAQPQQASGKRARVSNDRYRKNWATVFGAERKRAQPARVAAEPPAAKRPRDYSVN